VAFLEVLHKVANASARIATPPPLLTVADWADEYLFLSPEDSAEAGKYRTDRAPYQREMLEVVSDPNIKEVVYCTSSQIGKTLLSKCIIGYHIHQDPGPIIVMQPTVKIAETFSKDRLSPMVRDTPVLKRLIADPKSRSSGNTIDHKTFPGGHITMIGPMRRLIWPADPFALCLPMRWTATRSVLAVKVTRCFWRVSDPSLSGTASL